MHITKYYVIANKKPTVITVGFIINIPKNYSRIILLVTVVFSSVI